MDLNLILIELAAKLQYVELCQRPDGWLLRALKDDGKEGVAVEFTGKTPLETAQQALSA